MPSALDRLPEWLRRPVDLVAETFARFTDDDVPRLAAAMSYYMLLALAPVLLILNALLGLVGSKLGATPAAEKLAAASGPAVSGIASAVSWAGSYAPIAAVVLIVFGVVSVFGQFIHALETIWKAPVSATPVRAFLRYHLLSLGLLGVLTVALVAALIVALVLGFLGSFAFAYAAQLGVSIPPVLLSFALRSVLVFISAAALFSVAFTIAPARHTRWRDALPGALITAALFLVGESVLSYYLGNTGRFDVFGAYEFFVVLIVWIYYSALVALWGAELTRLLVLAAEERRSASIPGDDGSGEGSAGQ